MEERSEIEDKAKGESDGDRPDKPQQTKIVADTEQLDQLWPKVIDLNVGGTRYTTSLATLTKVIRQQIFAL